VAHRPSPGLGLILPPATEILGWAGTLLLLGAYALTSSGRLSGQAAGYHALNAIGAAGVAANVVARGAWPVATLEIIWALIGVVTLVRIALARRNNSRSP